MGHVKKIKKYTIKLKEMDLTYNVEAISFNKAVFEASKLHRNEYGLYPSIKTWKLIHSY